MIMTEVLYICLWYKDKKRTWSGTAWSLRQAMEPLSAGAGSGTFGSSVPQNTPETAEEEGTAPRAGICPDRLRLSGRYAAWRHRHRTDEKMPVFQFGGWPSGAHLASYLYQDLSISAILWLQREDPVGYRYCEYDQVPQKTLERRAARQLEQYRQSEGVFTMSRWLSEFLIRECGLPREKVHAVGGGINVDAAGIRPGSKEGRRILFVGRNFVRKGGPLVVQAFTILRKKYLWSAELYLAGAKESDIRDALRERQIRVEEVDWQKIHLLGDLGSEKLTDYYNLCDVFCMPSYFEAYGLVFAEALTYGLPCIGRDKFAMSEFIEDGCTGRLISGEDAEELALDLWEVLQDPKYREEVERRREWYLREYSWDKGGAENMQCDGEK